MKVNYQKELETLLAVLEKEKRVPRLLLHACCAPCSSYVLEYLSRYFEITVFYYNPNISPEEEYRKRVSEIRRLELKLEEAGMNEEAMKEGRKVLNRLKGEGSNSPEAGMLTDWLDLLTSLPWKKEEVREISMEDARDALNAENTVFQSRSNLPASIRSASVKNGRRLALNVRSSTTSLKVLSVLR